MQLSLPPCSAAAGAFGQCAACSQDDIAVLPETRIVLCEGNYLFLDEEPWAQLTSLFDDTW